MRLSEGEYLSSAYIDALKKTRSAYEADKTGTMSSINVHRDGKRILLQTGYNFHEGGEEFVIHEDGSISVAENFDPNTPKPDTHVVDGHAFRFSFRQNKPATYVFVNNATDFVSRMILVGKYRDKRGAAYEFSEEGWAVFPDRKFKFEIGLDHVLNGYDYYMDLNDKNKVWAFRRNGAELQIFATTNADDGPEEISSHRPYWSLQEVR